MTRVCGVSAARGDVAPEDLVRLQADTPRPWFWWVALGLAALLFGVEAWLIYRTVAGWPVSDLFLLQRLAG